MASFRSLTVYSASAALVIFAGLISPVLPAVASAETLDTLLPGITLDLPRTAPVAVATPGLTLPVPAANEVHAAADAPASGADIACLAKVIHHEAANQSRDGQLAVAQVIRNRTQASGFARSVCGVVAQRGQFFDVDGYRPAQDGRWQTALSVAKQAMCDDTAQVVPGALFYRASWSPVPSFMRHRQQVAVLGDHVFYR